MSARAPQTMDIGLTAALQLAFALVGFWAGWGWLGALQATGDTSGAVLALLALTAAVEGLSMVAVAWSVRGDSCGSCASPDG